ncbi:glutathione S-transferase [Powellomyces hirtus]|nr:glutathione S-transferase [Powellomyces hirtus]
MTAADSPRLPILFIGNKGYSSWSLRGYLACRLAGIQFQERIGFLTSKGPQDPEFRRHADAAGPAGKLPALHVPVDENGWHVVWESLAIIEYLAEDHPALWPPEKLARAHARSVSAEMATSFSGLRSVFATNWRLELPPNHPAVTAILEERPDIVKEIKRAQDIWASCRAFGKDNADDQGFLFGRPTAADAMFGPVVGRFRTYGFEVSDDARKYMETIESWDFYREWVEEGKKETAYIDYYDLPGVCSKPGN